MNTQQAIQEGELVYHLNVPYNNDWSSIEVLPSKKGAAEGYSSERFKDYYVSRSATNLKILAAEI